MAEALGDDCGGDPFTLGNSYPGVAGDIGAKAKMVFNLFFNLYPKNYVYSSCLCQFEMVFYQIPF
jgi:hypothetical protein